MGKCGCDSVWAAERARGEGQWSATTYIVAFRKRHDALGDFCESIFGAANACEPIVSMRDVRM